jgi:hypothetical protein
MLCSLNEVEAEVRKAARGAGFSWGLAEETGWAARFLAAHEWLCLAALIALFEWRQGRAHALVAPIVEGPVWHARGGPLCAITAGSAWQDFANASMLSEPVEFRMVSAPALLAPFIAASARRLAQPLALRFPSATLSFSGNRTWLTGSRAALSGTAAEAVTVDALEALPSGPACAITFGGIQIDDRSWSRLAEYAARTYVPSSADSRLYGAGAGLLDND